MRPTYAPDEVPSPRRPSGVSSDDRRTIEEQENILNGISSLDPPLSSLQTNLIHNGLPSNLNLQAQSVPGPITPHINIPKPIYFVTEPTDSPTYPAPRSIVDHHFQISPIPAENSNPSPDPLLLPGLQTYESLSPTSTEIIPISNSHPNSPSLDQNLATVFTHLAIKRKSSEEAEECQKSKLLRLCAPEPASNSSITTTHPLTNLPSKPKPIRPRKNYKRGVPRTRASKAGDVSHAPFYSDSGLCDVPVQQSLTRVEAELLMAPCQKEAPSEIDGRVAGPKQPHAQC
ncbi:hypothetical protein RHMOL_Rhmol01G0304500 [Rhododendron molle]|uniref:Uncharacterized protein n=1 Tax=Rhododendron molle TaxID=49168 RepID=A0ACC0Q7Q7_RHOML|nr:hypothetical protein RHMOL_Rhmol01G0304500 [Rhododendron molle]